MPLQTSLAAYVLEGKKKSLVIKRLVCNSDVLPVTSDEYREIDIERRPIEKWRHNLEYLHRSWILATLLQPTNRSHIYQPIAHQNRSHIK
jgi:hypothetical protein